MCCYLYKGGEENAIVKIIETIKKTKQYIQNNIQKLAEHNPNITPVDLNCYGKVIKKLLDNIYLNCT